MNDLLDWAERTSGHRFRQEDLLKTAMTHTSYAQEAHGQGTAHNERLEFLGDAVLELVVSERIFLENPEYTEGDLSKLRARLVCEEALYYAAMALGLNSRIRLGHGEMQSGGGQKPSVVSDATEAFIAALFLDGGLETAKGFILDILLPLLREADVSGQTQDCKSRLLEYCQKAGLGQPEYVLTGEEGPEHEKVFHMEARLGKRVLGSGSGRNKRQAGQDAARAALEEIGTAETGKHAAE